MSAETEMEQVESGGSAEDQSEDSLTQPKSESGPEFLSLFRCTHCYNLRWEDDSESSSSAEDSGSEVDWETEAESRSSCSELAFSEIRNINAESGGKDGDGGEMSEIQEAKNKKMTQRAPLINSSSLPNSPGPHLTPLSLLPHPHTVVSTLHLQVLSQKQDNNDDAFYIVKQQLSGREEEEEVEKTGRTAGVCESVFNREVTVYDVSVADEHPDRSDCFSVDTVYSVCERLRSEHLRRAGDDRQRR
ncbi:hypothetical protein ABVT39_013655 [Epinephelus coioides]